MIEVCGNLWTYPADVRVITTNGTVKKNGDCVMGRGCALEAKQRWPEIAKHLGDNLKAFGNQVFMLQLEPRIYSFPVKRDWYERASIDLIAKSAYELSACVNDGFDGRDSRITVVMPRPGCGNGGLKWADVKPIIAPILDDRFHVITFK